MDLEHQLAHLVGPEHVLTEPDLKAGHETDWTGRWSAPTYAVVRPASTAEVTEVLTLCTAEGVAVVPQGGNTGLVGGGVPRAALPAERQIVLSTRRLDTLAPVDRKAMQVTVGAGVTLGSWREHARAAGVDTGIDFASRDSATVGGAISTNAGGSRVLRFGTMRSQIVGVEAVLATGDVVGSLAGLAKETAGLSWPALLCGAEGTLGVVTTARLRLVPRYAHVVTAMVAMESLAHAVALLAELRSRVASLDMVEFLQGEALELVADHLGGPPPVEPTESVLLVECADHRDPTDDLLAVLSGGRGVGETAIASDEPRRARLVAFRDRMTEAIAARVTRLGSAALKLDVAVPVDELPRLIAMVSGVAQGDGARLISFGHLAEGNLHLNFLSVSDPDRVTDVVLGTVAELGGTISAEHGIGVAKASRLALIRSARDLAAQRRLARALDPAGIMNPGVLGRIDLPEGG